MIRRALSTALLTVCLAACTTAGSEAGTPPPAADPAPPTQPSPTPPQASCNADAARIVVGQVATPDVVEKARLAAGAQLVRTLKPGQVVTMEYHSSRLNIDVNEGNTVTNVRCG